MAKLKIIVLILIVVLITGCTNKEKIDDDIPGDKKISSISFAEGTDTFNFQLDEFLLEDIKIEVKYSDKTKEIIPLDISMISKSDFEMLFTTGTYFININYEGKTLQALIYMNWGDEIISSLPKIVIYKLKTITDDLVTYSYYYTGSGGFISFQMLFQGNENLEGLTVSQNGNLEGVFASKVEETEINILYSQGKKQLDSIEMFSITFNKDLDINLDETNSFFYSFDKEVFIEDECFYFNR